MMQLRWLITHQPVPHEREWHSVSTETTRTLQFCFQYDPTITAGLGPHSPSNQKQWSPWTDVPEVT